METSSVICEILMVALFGASWPFNIIRAYKARTAKGTSLYFTLLIAIGYVMGIISKITASINYGEGYWNYLKIFAFVFYCINLAMLTVAILIYFRNKKIDEVSNKV